MRLPEFLTKLSPVRETLEALETGEALLASDVEEAMRQLYIDTADRGLRLWEADFSLEGGGTDEARRAAVKAALAGGRTLTPDFLAELCRTIGGGDWSQVNEDFENWTATAYAAAFGSVPKGAGALEAAVERLKPAHLAVEVHPAGVFSLAGGWRSALTGGTCREARGDDGLPAPAERRAALTGGLSPEVSGGDAFEAGSLRRAKLSGAACREVSGTDAAGAGTARHTALTGCVSFCFRAPARDF